MNNPTNPETILGDQPVGQIPTVAPITQRPVGLDLSVWPAEVAARIAARRKLEDDAEDALDRHVREHAEALRDGGWTVTELKSEPEWQQMRALYFVYCDGVEDALYDRAALLAAAVKKNDAHWFGQIALDAWNEYADAALVKRINAKLEELAEDAGAIMQAEAVGK